MTTAPISDWDYFPLSMNPFRCPETRFSKFGSKLNPHRFHPATDDIDWDLLRREWDEVRQAFYARKNGFNPAEPRIPINNPGAGRWTRLAGMDRASGFDLGTARAASMFNLVGQLTEGGWAIDNALFWFGQWSGQNEPNKQAVLAFTAIEYTPSGTISNIKADARKLDREEVNELCPRFEEVQERTDFAASTVSAIGIDGNPMKAAQYGTAVHSNLKNQIEALGNPNFRAEVSAVKGKEEKYGTKGSIRVDVLENVGNGTVCVYDIKTGKSGLSWKRMDEIAKNVYNDFGLISNLIITEIRPRK